MSLIAFFKNNLLKTQVGEFKYSGDVGDGGNAKVLSFSKAGNEYAVKFLPPGRDSALARFRDEFFCATQIPTHRNVVHSYHLDSVSIDGVSYSFIIMKKYESSLHKAGSIAALDDEAKALKGFELLRSLCAGVGHLHANQVIHRDIKPQNIFVSPGGDGYVVGDLGIAHFSDEIFAREAKTRGAERLANFSCCAPEQVNSESPPSVEMDVFAIGQVLNWFLRGSFVRGGGRSTYSGSNINLIILDKIIDRCIQDDPKKRFSSIAGILDYEKELRSPPKDPWTPYRDLDRAFRSSIPKVKTIHEVTDAATIDRFLLNFSTNCNLGDFWYVNSGGGDNALNHFSRLEGGRWLVADCYECVVEKLICYKHQSEWQSFFVVVVAADSPFPIISADGSLADRPQTANWQEDAAALYEGEYIELQDAYNGYVLKGEEMIEMKHNSWHERHRFLNRDALLIVPSGAGVTRSTDRSFGVSLLASALTEGELSESAIRAFLDSTVMFTDRSIIERL